MLKTVPVSSMPASNNINFRGATKSNIKENNSKEKGKVLIGLAVAGAIGLALLAIKKGKVPKELSLEDFKAGKNKFIKGKAYKPDGTPFSGSVVQIMPKDGTKVVLTYENGTLKSSEFLKPGEKGKFLQDKLKLYKYDENGVIDSVINHKAVGHASPVDSKDVSSRYVVTETLKMDKIRKSANNKARMKKWQQNTADVKSKFEEASNRSQCVYDACLTQNQSNDELAELNRRYAHEEKIRSTLDGKIKVAVNDSKSRELQELADKYKFEEARSAILLERTYSRPADVTADTIEAYLASRQTPENFSEKLVHRNAVNNVIDELNDYWYGLFKEKPFSIENVNIDKNGVFVDFTKEGLPKMYIEPAKLKADNLHHQFRRNKFYRVFQEGGNKGTFRVSNNGNLSEFNNQNLYIPEEFRSSLKLAEDRSGYKIIYDWDNKATKLLEKTSNGKYKTNARISRANSNFEIIDPVYRHNWRTKLVKHLDNGNTVVTYEGDNSTLKILRDKFGNILEENKVDKSPRRQPVRAILRWQ